MSAIRPTTLRVQKEQFDPALLVGELRAFLEQLGTPETLNCMSASASSLLRKSPSVPALKRFLQTYKTQVLFPHEWPAIFRAYYHVRHNQTRELLELDRELAGIPALEKLRTASRRIGQWQLNQLGPLRGEPVIKKYRAAVEEGRADAWHTTIYGLTLAVYSFPLRQGLLNYAMQLLAVYARSAAQGLAIGDEEQQQILDEALSELPAKLEQLLAGLPANRIE